MSERLFARRGTFGFGALAGLVLVLALGANYRDYFDVQATQRQPAGLSTVFSRLVRDVNDRYRV
jgi:hypothetical protein